MWPGAGEVGLNLKTWASPARFTASWTLPTWDSARAPPRTRRAGRCSKIRNRETQILQEAPTQMLQEPAQECPPGGASVSPSVTWGLTVLPRIVVKSKGMRHKGMNTILSI